MEIKTKVNKWDLIKLKSFCIAKETLSKVKRQPSEWEKIIAHETTDKGLMSKICKQVIQLSTRKATNSIKSGKSVRKSFLRPRRCILQLLTGSGGQCSIILSIYKLRTNAFIV